MREDILRHYLETGTYTYAGPYAEYFRSLPDDVAELGNLVCAQVIHRVTLREGNEKANASMIYGDMTEFPWHRMRCEDDILLTAAAMMAELFRLDPAGCTTGRKTKDKIVVCCRYVSVLMSAILKAKGIPCRSRAGFAPYFTEGESWDHWINQYWYAAENRWVTFDGDGFYDRTKLGFDQYDIPEDRFDWSAKAWLDVRKNGKDGSAFLYADGRRTNSLKAIIRYMFYDFHSIMNNEITFSFQPCFIDGKFDRLSAEDLEGIDALAELMLDPDGNFEALAALWNSNKKYRILNSPLVGDWDNNYDSWKRPE